MAGGEISKEAYVALYERAAREKEERKRAMDAIVDLAIERAYLRSAIRAMVPLLKDDGDIRIDVVRRMAETALEWDSAKEAESTAERPGA